MEPVGSGPSSVSPASLSASPLLCPCPSITISVVYNLVKVRGFKLEAARKVMRLNPTGADKTAQVLERLFEIRAQLKELKDSLELMR